MSLPISTIVDVNVVISPSLPSKKGFGVAGIVSNEIDNDGGQQSQRVVYFGSISEVADKWPLASETYLMAQSYFSQSPAPDQLAILAHYSAGSNAFLFGGDAPEINMAIWNAEATGSFNATIDATSVDVTGIDTTGAADLDAVASIVETALQAADAAFAAALVAWNSDELRFEIDSGVADGAINFLQVAASGNDISGLLDMTSSGTAVLQQGTPVETVVDALTAAELFNDNWYGVLILPIHVDTDEVLNVAAWAEARTKIFSSKTNDPTTLQLGTVDNNAYKLNNSGYTRSDCNYSGDPASKIDAAVLGRAFTVDFGVPDSVITLKFKPLSGIPTEQITTGQKAGLDEKRCNALINIAGQSMYAEGFMSSSLFFDERHGVDWLVGEIESNVFNYLISRATKVPLTDKGASSIQQQVIRALDSAVSNGLLATGTTSDGVFLPNGYETSVVKVADMNQVDRANRNAPPISFTALLAGATHFVQINGTVER